MSRRARMWSDLDCKVNVAAASTRARCKKYESMILADSLSCVGSAIDPHVPQASQGCELVEATRYNYAEDTSSYSSTRIVVFNVHPGAPVAGSYQLPVGT